MNTSPPDDLLKRLWAHAGLPDRTASSVDISGISWAVKEIVDRTGDRSRLRQKFLDLLDCLDRLNKFLNGAVPSGTGWLSKQQSLDRDTAYALSMIIRCFANAAASPELGPDDARLLITYNWAVCAAIESVLAGDIDDLMSELQGEAWARGIPFDIGT